MKKVILRDKIFCKNHYLNLTDEQYSLLYWLDSEDIFRDVEIEVFEDYEFKEI